MHRIVSTTLTNYPADMQEPRIIHERADGAGDDAWINMRKLNYLHFRQRDTRLHSWQWSEDKLFLPGCLAVRNIRISYIKRPSPIVDESTLIEVAEADTFISAYIASLAAGFKGRNREEAAVLRNIAMENLAIFLGDRDLADTGVKEVNEG